MTVTSSWLAGYRRTHPKGKRPNTFTPDAQQAAPLGIKPTQAQTDAFNAVTAGSKILGDPGYLAATAAGVQGKQLADGQYDFTTGNLRSDYGYDTAGNIDPNNPYSRAALLQESYRRSRLGNTNSYAAQGQLYSGALQNAQDETTRQYDVGDDQLRKGYAAGVGQAGLDKLSAYGSADAATGSALAAALTRLLGGGS